MNAKLSVELTADKPIQAMTKIIDRSAFARYEELQQAKAKSPFYITEDQRREMSYLELRMRVRMRVIDAKAKARDISDEENYEYAECLRMVMKYKIPQHTKVQTKEKDTSAVLEEVFNEAEATMPDKAIDQMRNSFDRITDDVHRILRITNSVQMSRKDWKGSLGTEVRWMRKIALKLDKVLNPEDYAKAKLDVKERVAHPDDILDIRGELIKPAPGHE